MFIATWPAFDKCVFNFASVNTNRLLVTIDDYFFSLVNVNQWVILKKGLSMILILKQKMTPKKWQQFGFTIVKPLKSFQQNLEQIGFGSSDYHIIFYSGTEKQVVAYDYTERLAKGVMECQVCFDSKSFFSLFIKIMLKFEYTNCIIVFSIISF